MECVVFLVLLSCKGSQLCTSMIGTCSRPSFLENMVNRHRGVVLHCTSTCLIVAKTDLTFDLRDCHWVASVKGTWILLAVRQGHGLVSTASNLIVF